MAKKQPKPDPNRRRIRAEPQPANLTSKHQNRSNNRIVATTIIIFVVLPALIALTYRHFNQPSPSSFAHQRGLVKADVTYEQILAENSRVSDNVTQRHFGNSVLAYVTPWNAAGYDLAKRFCSRFTHISPVWYDLKSQGKKLALEGRHNADIGWISELRLRGKAKVLPRVVLEAVPKGLLTNKKQRDKAIDLIVSECKDMGYDGVVLESWSRWAAYGVLHDASLRKLALQFVKQLGDSLHDVSSRENGQPLQLVYVIGPPYSEKLEAHDFGPEDLQMLSDSVDGFSLMTYDYSSSYSPGPNAPLTWVRSTIKLILGASGNAKKIFVGINFYGNDYVIAEGGGAQAITGRDYLTILDQHKPIIRWKEEFAEHYFFYSDDQYREHAVFYPTLMSIATRLEEARSWGAGISIWEIGQGLDYFFDLL